MSSEISLPAHKTETIKSNDVNIFYRVFGSAGETPILIVHGQSYFSWDWIEIASALSADREVVAMDMRGFGNSEWSAGKRYKVQDFGSDIVNICKSRNWEKVILVGHSMGGRNVTYTAATNPDLVERVILVDYTPSNAKAGALRVMTQSIEMPDRFESMDEALTYFGHTPENATPKIKARFENYLKSTDNGYVVRRDTHFKEQFRRMRDEGHKPDHGADLWECLEKIKCPILVIRGSQSDLFAPETAETVREKNPRAIVVEIQGGHNIPGDNPSGLVEVARSFI